jgi:hypothetical protein
MDLGLLRAQGKCAADANVLGLCGPDAPVGNAEQTDLLVDALDLALLTHSRDRVMLVAIELAVAGLMAPNNTHG